ncbi:nitroreductase [Staphylococcus sp. SQ8-PEA]|uniref:Nitroreductase n=1 Tax=Staphylococcus marylandisciuri TaxID=2981529 RepID=A0ABT2QSY1_9STAP|nr:nitroreductase [Staphylococcus marylandisciuri]MCU5747082.1 nitroreductase [Staphylococcus marylandisciuri]
MELQEAIANRRSYKKFKHDMHIDDDVLYKSIERATDAPNHKMREPWRVVHISKDRLGDMSRDVGQYAFKGEDEKKQDHYNTVTKLGGILALIVKKDPRQKQNLENYMAFGAFAQNLMLLLHEAGIGTCWKSPQYIFMPEVRNVLGVQDDEDLVGLLYLTDQEERVAHRKRRMKNLITEY